MSLNIDSLDLADIHKQPEQQPPRKQPGRRGKIKGEGKLKQT